MPTSTVIRSEKKGFQKGASGGGDKDDITNRFPYPYADGVTSANVGKANPGKPLKVKPHNGETMASKREEDKYTTPTYTITHRLAITGGSFRDGGVYIF